MKIGNRIIIEFVSFDVQKSLLVIKCYGPPFASHFYQKKQKLIPRNWSFFPIFSDVINDKTDCPYCPAGMECDPATYTCVKGLYKNIMIHHFVSFYSAHSTCSVNMYICIVHVYFVRITCNFNYSTFDFHTIFPRLSSHSQILN